MRNVVTAADERARVVNRSMARAEAACEEPGGVPVEDDRTAFGDFPNEKQPDNMNMTTRCRVVFN